MPQPLSMTAILTRFSPPVTRKGNPPDRPAYNFDGCSPDVVLTRMAVKDGRIVLPDGMSYRLLALPDSQTMTPRLLAKIVELGDGLLTIYKYLLLASVIISWVNADPYNPIVNFIYRVTDPLLRRIRRHMPDTGMLDLSPLVAFALIERAAPGRTSNGWTPFSVTVTFTPRPPVETPPRL